MIFFFRPTDDSSQESKILGPNHDAIEMISATHLPPFTTEYKFYCCYWLYDLVALSGYISFEFGVFATNIRYPLCLFTELFLSDSAKNKNSQIYLSKKKILKRRKKKKTLRRMLKIPKTMCMRTAESEINSYI